MTAEAVLENQHRRVDALFVALAEAGVNASALVTELATLLMAHMVVEEELLYPIVKPSKRDEVLANYEEHALVAFGLRRLMMADISDESFAAKVTAVRELFSCHAADEERDLICAVASTLGQPESVALGTKMELRLEELLAMGYHACRSMRGKDERLALQRRSGFTERRARIAPH
jgi:Hemerythrin HHE cation binding domain